MLLYFESIYLIVLLWPKHEISSKKGAAIFISFCSFSFNTISSTGNMGIDLFKQLKQHSHDFITASNSNTF